MWFLKSKTYLEHHGILGMRWGVRRYQNRDGSLTPEGRLRYAEAMDEYLSPHKKKKRDVIEARTAVKNHYKDAYNRRYEERTGHKSDGSKDGYEEFLDMHPELNATSGKEHEDACERATKDEDLFYQSFAEEYAKATLSDLGLEANDQLIKIGASYVRDPDLLRTSLSRIKKEIEDEEDERMRYFLWEDDYYIYDD